VAALHPVDRATYLLARLRGARSLHRPTSVGTLHALSVEGDGDLPPLVLVHGLGAHAGDYLGLLLALRRRARTIVAIDLPGHGKSASPAGGMTRPVLETGVLEALDALIGAEPAVVFGNSLGGLAALRYTLQRPARVRGLILSSPGGAAMSEPVMRAYFGRFKNSTRAELRDFVDRLYHKPPWFRAIVERVVRSRFAQPAVRELLSVATPADLLTADEVRALATPTLFMWGRGDRLQPPEQLEFFRKHLPAAVTVEEPEGHGHCPFMERPREVADRIIGFARSV
jgi:pimeloyl-ACP methyl ester carboxylesterase